MRGPAPRGCAPCGTPWTPLRGVRGRPRPPRVRSQGTGWTGGSADTAGTTLLPANAAEARLLTGCGDAEDAARALAGRYPVVVVKLGPEGAL